MQSFARIKAVKFCRDCRYIESHPGTSTPRCSHKGSIRVGYLVDGDTSIDHRKDCYDMRNTGACGHEGKLFEPRP